MIKTMKKEVHQMKINEHERSSIEETKTKVNISCFYLSYHKINTQIVVHITNYTTRAHTRLGWQCYNVTFSKFLCYMHVVHSLPHPWHRKEEVQM